MSTRETKLTIATGIKRIGKSYTTFKICYAYSRGIREYGFYPRKVLIFDINNEYGVFKADPSDAEGIEMLGRSPVYTDALDVYDVHIFTAQNKPEMRRIVPIHTRTVKDKKGNIISREGDEWNADEAVGFLLHTIKNFRGGLLWIEDMTSLFGDQIPKDVMAFITRNAHRDLDIIMHLQSISPILPRFWQNCEWTRFHKQNDGVDASKHKLKEKYVMYKIAEKMVQRQFLLGNTRFYLWINNPEQYITGAITSEMATTAIKDYLSENYIEMRGLQNKRDENGVSINNYQKALQLRTEQLYSIYFRKLNE